MSSYLLFLSASLIVIITPGPDMLYVLTRGIAAGRKSGAASAMGVATGLLVHTAAAALGVALLLQASTYALPAVKILGGIYLIFLGVKMIRKRKSFSLSRNGEYSKGSGRCYLQGVLSNVLNPKIAVFFLAFLPQFIPENSPQYSAVMLLYGLVFAGITLILYLVIGIFAGVIGEWIGSRGNMGAGIQAGAGSVLLLLGARLLIGCLE